MAMAANAVVRATRDIDLMVAADADNIARLRRALWTVCDDPDIDQITAEDLAGAYPAVQYWPPDASCWTTDAGRPLSQRCRHAVRTDRR